MLSTLKQKFRALAGDAQYKGLWKFIQSKYYEHYYRFRFRKLGVVHPDGTFNLEQTNSKSLNNDAHPNQASAYYHLRKAFKYIDLPKEKVNLLDIGCGYGRVLNLGMMMKFKKVFGIELDETAVEKAMTNCARMHEQGFTTPYQVDKGDAFTYNIPESVNLIYIFNPFGEKTMIKVSENIIAYINRYDKPVYVAYCIPSFPETFLKFPGYEKIYQSFNKKKDHSDLLIFRLNGK